MPVRPEKEQAALDAIERLVTGKQQRAPDSMLVDRNLMLESGLAKPTLYRCSVAMERWRTAKEESVRMAIARIAEDLRVRRSRPLTDEDLLRTARVDHAAFHRMNEEVLLSWEDVKKNQAPSRPRRRRAQDDPDQVITSLVSKLYALTLAVKHRDAIIAAQAEELARLGGRVVKLREGLEVSKRVRFPGRMPGHEPPSHES